MQEFTLAQIGMQVTALQNFFDQVTLIDPLAQAEVNPVTLQATGHADAVPVLNADGRGWQPILGEDTGFVFYQNIQVEHRPFVLAATYFLTADLPANDREANALLRLLGQYREEMRRDYVTGVYNRAFLDSTYRKKVAAAACAGKPALATGEEPLSTETSQTGVSTRVLEIYGGPFDDEREASIMHQQSGMNCGWAGPAYIGMLMHTDEKSITDKYDEMMQYVYQISRGKSGSHIAGIAAVALTDAIIDTWIFNNGEWLKRYENGEFDTESAKNNTECLQIDPVSWERAKEMARNILQEQMNADTGDVNENATQYIVDWILSNKDSFGEKAFGTCLGMIQNKNAYIFPSMLTQALTKAGYSSRKTLKYLADKGLIGVSVLKDGSTKNSVTKWFNNRNCRFVEFHLGDLAEEKDPLMEEEEIAEQMKPQQMNLPGMGDGWQTIPDEEADKLPFN